MKKLLFIVLCGIFLSFAPFSFAQTLPIQLPTPISPEGWYITSFDTNQAIKPDGTVNIRESITVDFKDLQKHGIFRDIPVIYEDEQGNKTYTTISINSVKQDGSDIQYDSYQNGNFRELKIGNPDITISGNHTYIINYTATGVLRGFPDYDELYWNITGNDWPVPILSASSIISLPENGVLKFMCFEGPKGSQISDCVINSQNEKEVTIQSSRPLNAYEGLTGVLGYKKGLTPILTVERPKTEVEQFLSIPSLIILFTSIILGIALVTTIWFKHGRDLWFGGTLSKKREHTKPFNAHETVVVEYTPPDKLRPAEIGVLMDERADTLDVTATIIDLATRGFLKIREIPKNWMFGKTDYELTKIDKDTKELLKYESELYSKLFEKEKTVKISELKTTFYTHLSTVKKQLYKDILSKKLFVDNPEVIRTKYAIIGTFMTIAGIFLTSMLRIFENIYMLDVTIAIIIAGVLMLIFASKMPRRTAAGRDLYRRSRGYKLFIDTAEKHRQKFFEDKNLFNEILPYAIVFGITEKFAEAMREMGIKPENPNWYSGTHSFSYVAFGNNIASFSSSFSASISSTPSKGGGFSGGGSSGGGFGGGGGGSW